MAQQFEKESVNTIRTLSIDAIDKANSGHPGLPLGAAPTAYALWSEHMKFNPEKPDWIDRDRFVLSAGHGSALLYSVLHLCGYDLSIDDLKNFRQWNSKTPGHPEFGHTAGVETTTGPLGQGAANAVGMAIAEKMLANKFNTSDIELIDHYTYCFVGDGCLMEGISSEAASIAGYMKLGKLVMLYDSNDISLDGPTDLTFTEDVRKRYESYGWHVVQVDDGDNDIDGIAQAISTAKNVTDKPSIIIIKTTIGYGSPNQGSEKTHGAPLGDEGSSYTKKSLGMDPEKKFYVSDDVNDNFQNIIGSAVSVWEDWTKKKDEYVSKYPELDKELNDFIELKLPENWIEVLPKFEAGGSMATRVSNHTVMNAVGNKLPWLVGGDADLSCSTKIFLKDGGYFDGIVQDGRNIRMGVREHAMAAIANGISFHGGLRPFTSTFFSFVDYMRPSIRLAALCKIPVIYIYTHDSIAVGEDGPTHQPVEQLMSVRSMPGIKVIRPGDANEVSVAWKYMMENADTPYVLVLSRQNLVTVDREKYGCALGLEKGAYVVADSENP
ncbi:MAG: transketolase, partial [Candidatus Delongbacteria bacterium]|nr:transketolase [Candidatus Delongbacteria bacterium]